MKKMLNNKLCLYLLIALFIVISLAMTILAVYLIKNLALLSSPNVVMIIEIIGVLIFGIASLIIILLLLVQLLKVKYPKKENN